MSRDGREVVVVGAVRTPIGRGHPERGILRDVHPVALLGRTYAELLRRTGVDGAAVEMVLAGCVQQVGEQGWNVARNAWLHEGLPVTTAATTLDAQCGSGQQAVNVAAALIASGIHDVVVGSGVEHMGRVSFATGAEIQQRYGAAVTAELLARHPVAGQGLGAEMIADAYAIGRPELDELALRSHRLAARARDGGRFDRETVAIAVGDELHAADQGIRDDTTLAALAALPPAFKPDGRITAGTSSQISDGAAAVLLMSRERADALGVAARAKVIDQTTVGCDPVRMLEGPIPATRRLLERNAMTMADVDRTEINEAFAPVVAAWAREHRPDMDTVNVRGGAMALGHPLGASGARLVTSLLHILEDDDRELGLVTMCCGGGLGTGTLLQRV